MVWGNMFKSGFTTLSLPPLGTAMNGSKCVEMLSCMFTIVRYFSRTRGPCHRSKVARSFRQKKTSSCSSGSETVRTLTQSRICGPTWKVESEKQPSSAAELVKVMKEIGTKEISKEYCQSLMICRGEWEL